MKKPASSKAAMAVIRQGLPLGIVPEDLRTPELCTVAVKKNGTNLYRMPEGLKTPALSMVAERLKKVSDFCLAK